MKEPLTFVLFFLRICSLFMPSSAFTVSSFFGARRQSTPRSYSRRTRCAEGLSSEDSFSIGDLQRELSRRKAEDAMASQAAAPPLMDDREAFMEEQMMLRKNLVKAFVLIYNQGQAEEGIYTLFAEGRNVLRAWEDKSEAARYALMLRAEELPLGKPTELSMPAIIGFCKENGVGLELVPRGRGLHPPSRNKPELDFDASLQEIGRRPAATKGRKPLDESLFTPQELARIKSQFEKSLEGEEEDA